MNKRSLNLIGVGLISVGALSLVFNLAVPWLGPMLATWAVELVWPLAVISIGGICLGTPFLRPNRRALGSLSIIFGMLTLATGGILFLANLINDWDIWAWLWPVNVLGLALGFFVAAAYSRSIWLVVPAVIIGMTGLVLQFCAFTGMWATWAVVWPVEPLAVGLALLIVAVKKHSKGLFIAGFSLLGVAGIGWIAVLLSAAVLGSKLGLLNLVGPVLFMAGGGVLLAWNVFRRLLVSNIGA